MARSFQIYWIRDRVEVQPERDANFLQASDGHLIIVQTREKDKGNYTCVAENVANTRMSPVARLTVVGERNRTSASLPSSFKSFSALHPPTPLQDGIGGTNPLPGLLTFSLFFLCALIRRCENNELNFFIPPPPVAAVAAAACWRLHTHIMNRQLTLVGEGVCSCFLLLLSPVISNGSVNMASCIGCGGDG
jgi:hypothetical protein